MIAQLQPLNLLLEYSNCVCNHYGSKEGFCILFIPLAFLIVCAMSSAWPAWFLGDAEVDARVEVLTTTGVSCRLRPYRTDNFAALYVEPLAGWLDLATDASLAVTRSEGWDYHISLTKELIDEDAWGYIRATLSGVVVDLVVERVTCGGVALLSTTRGIGAHVALQDMYASGNFWHKAAGGFGLHMSM
jgi:hypothetical protein